MKKQLIGIVGLLLTFGIAMTGCSSSSGVAESLRLSQGMWEQRSGAYRYTAMMNLM